MTVGIKNNIIEHFLFQVIFFQRNIQGMGDVVNLLRRLKRCFV